MKTEIKKLADKLYIYMHTDEDWSNHTVRHLVPLSKRDGETKRRYEGLVKFIKTTYQK